MRADVSSTGLYKCERYGWSGGICVGCVVAVLTSFLSEIYSVLRWVKVTYVSLSPMMLKGVGLSSVTV